MKILFVLEHYHPYIGGVETLFIALAEALVETGHEVNVLSSKYKNTLASEENINGVLVHRVKCWNRFGFTLLSIPKAIRLAAQADFIHTSTYNAGFPAFVAAKWTGKKIYITFHELWGKLWFDLPFLNPLQRYLFYTYEQMIARLPFTHFIAVSRFTCDALLNFGIAADKITLIHNGIDYKHFSNYVYKPPRQFTFCFFGRLGVSKGLDLLIPAFADFNKKYPSSHLKLIIPKVPKGMFRRIMQLIKEHKMEASITMLHELPKGQLFEAISNSSGIVIPSYSEGFCFAAVESIAIGMPIISSDQGALKEVISGKYIRMKSFSREGLELAMEQAYLGEWEENQSKYFKLETSLQQYISFYEQNRNKR